MCVPKYPYPVVGGLEKQAHELAKALLGLGVKVHVISTAFSAGAPPNERVEGIEVTRLRWSNRRTVRFPSLTTQLLLELYRRRHDFDVIHSHQFSWYGLLVIVAGLALGKPVLTKLPNVGTHGLPGLRNDFLGALKVAVISRTTAFVAMSKESLDELREIGFPRERVLATPNGIVLEPAPPASMEQGADARDCRVVFVGRLCKDKGVEDLLRAWAVVHRERGDLATLELWGEGELDGRARELCRALGIEHSVHLRGRMSDVRSRLRTMDLLVLPSYAEGNSNAILEAMAEGLPIVSTPVGGTAMLVGPDGAPFLVAPGDVDGLASALIRLTSDPKARRRLGALMRARVSALFNMRVVANRYRDAYAALARGESETMGRLSSELFASSALDSETPRHTSTPE